MYKQLINYYSENTENDYYGLKYYTHHRQGFERTREIEIKSCIKKK